MNWKYIFNPFLKYSERQLFVVGILGMIFTIFASFFSKTEIVGLFHLEPNQKITLLSATANCISSYASATLFLFVLGKLFNKKTRFIDILNGLLLSQAMNFFVITIGAFADSHHILKTAQSAALIMSHQLQILAVALCTMPFMIYSFVLYYNGFQTATNIKKWQQITIFCFATFLFIIIYQTISQFINI